MRHHQHLLALLVLLAAAGALAAPAALAQQEVVLKISEGMPMISLALPEFVVRGSSPAAQAAAQEIRQALSEDVKYTRIFQLLPKEYYSYIRPLDLDKILFKDWDSVQARLLVTGEVSPALAERLLHLPNGEGLSLASPAGSTWPRKVSSPPAPAPPPSRSPRRCAPRPRSPSRWC